MNLPSKEECERWNPEQVARFLCQKQMQQCAETVNIFKINGHRLLNMSQNDISKFCLIQQPQLQKIVQDINKNEGSLLNKLRKLKAKSGPKVPERDYQGEHFEERWSDESDEYDDPQEDGYEPPPSHRVFSPSTASPFTRDDYVDSCRHRSYHGPRKPPRPAKATKPLPPEPHQMASDEEDYIDPESGNHDNYIDPTSPPSVHSSSVASKPLLKVPDTSAVYEVPLPEETISPVSRLGPNTQSQSLPSKFSPRLIRNHPIIEPSTDTEYEVCDPDNTSLDTSLRTERDRRPKPLPKPLLKPLLKPLPKEKSPKPVIRMRPLIKHEEHQSQTQLLTSRDQPPKAFTTDFRRPMIPLPQIIKPHRQADLSSRVENGLQDMDEELDIHRQPWYANTCDRKTAEEVLIESNKDGSFMVRKSSGQVAEQPYTLVVLYNSKVYNIPVRFIKATQQYALGREKKGEEHFTSVSRIIENHLKIPLVLIDSQSNTRDTTKLQHAVRP